MDQQEHIKNAISTFFRNNNLSLQKLPQVYLLYLALQKIGKEPTLVKGYLVNHLIQVYYISCWVVCDGQVHNIALTYPLDCTTELVETLSNEIKCNYLNMDADPTAIINSFNACINGEFLHDLQKRTSTNIYSQIARFYYELMRMEF